MKKRFEEITKSNLETKIQDLEKTNSDLNWQKSSLETKIQGLERNSSKLSWKNSRLESQNSEYQKRLFELDPEHCDNQRDLES